MRFALAIQLISLVSGSSDSQDAGSLLQSAAFFKDDCRSGRCQPTKPGQPTAQPVITPAPFVKTTAAPTTTMTMRPEATCQTFQCGVGFIKSSSAGCGSPECDKLQCCTQEACCDDFTCHKGFVKTSDKPCSAISCTRGQCCKPEATCKSFTCGKGHFKSSTGGCNAEKCTQKDCCDQEATCKAHKCGAGLLRKAQEDALAQTASVALDEDWQLMDANHASLMDANQSFLPIFQRRRRGHCSAPRKLLCKACTAKAKKALVITHAVLAAGGGAATVPGMALAGAAGFSAGGPLGAAAGAAGVLGISITSQAALGLGHVLHHLHCKKCAEKCPVVSDEEKKKIKDKLEALIAGQKDKCNWKCYLARYPDLSKAFGHDQSKAALHYNSNGRRERRACSCTQAGCNWKAYLARYPDLRKAFGNDETKAASHYLSHGRKEKRDCSQKKTTAAPTTAAPTTAAPTTAAPTTAAPTTAAPTTAAPMPFVIGCKDGSCSDEECCDEEASCDSYKCGVGFVRTSMKPCGKIQCEQSQCCTRQVANQQSRRRRRRRRQPHSHPFAPLVNIVQRRRRGHCSEPRKFLCKACTDKAKKALVITHAVLAAGGGAATVPGVALAGAAGFSAGGPLGAAAGAAGVLGISITTQAALGLGHVLHHLHCKKCAEKCPVVSSAEKKRIQQQLEALIAAEKKK